MALFSFSSNETPRIFFATRASHLPAARHLAAASGRYVPGYGTTVSNSGKWNKPPRRLSRRGCQQAPLQGLLGCAQLRCDVPLVLIEAWRRHRHRDGDDIAERVTGGDAGSADALRVLLAVEGDPGLAHRFQIPEQVLEPRQRARRALFVAGADEPGDGVCLEYGEIGIAVGRAVQGEGFADRRARTQPVRADHLVDEHEM